MSIAKFVGLLFFSLVALLVSVNVSGAYDFDPNAPRLNFAHASAALLVNGKADYNPDVAYEPIVNSSSFTKPYKPQFVGLYIDFLNFGKDTEGWVEVTPNETVEVVYNGRNAVIDKETITGTTRFNVFYTSEYYLGDANGIKAEFQNGAETGFLGQPFSTAVGKNSFDGSFPKRIRSTKEQIETLKCVPYIELIAKEDGKTLKEVKFRFVDPNKPATALTRNTNANVNVVTQIDIRTKSDRSTTRNKNMVRFTNGKKLEGVADFSNKNILISDIEWISPYFRFGDSTGIRAAVDHNWRFYMSKDGN